MIIEDVNWCISTTNDVIDRWKRTKLLHQVTEDDVNQILLGYIRKRLVSSKGKQEFKELKRRLLIHVDKDLHIANIMINVSDIQRGLYNTVIDNKMLTLESHFNRVDYKSLIGKNIMVEDLYKIPDDITDLNFESIKNIKF